MQAIFRTYWCLSLCIYPGGSLIHICYVQVYLGRWFNLTVQLISALFFIWVVTSTWLGFGDWSSMMWSCRGGNAELAAAVPGLEVVAGHKDAVTWWCSFGDWITSTGLVVNSVHVRAFFGFQTGPQTTTKPMISIFLGQKELFILSVRILVSTCGTVCT